ncbi:unnamed protein product [Cuscuta campestris]|uniref:IST1-like protein n=1 Tax=Cuscuta campestris TaxID=132261 RepID=A0A484MJI2_9ASTE|nr:unnamed protein product [Cuscuta campestris]
MAVGHWKRAMKIGLSSLFRRGFNSSKCKTMARMTTARIKLLRNKREVVVRQMRRDIAMLLESRQDASARIRVEHVMREQNMLAANEIIELFCDLIVSRLAIIAKQRECPADLKEGISSLIFAAPRCSEIPELVGIRDVFEKKYGKDFVSEATDLRPNAGVNRMLIEKLSVKTPSGEAKLKILKEIAKEYQVKWDTAESEVELLKAPEERIEGPATFVSATSLPIKQPVPNSHTHLNTNNGNFEDSASAAKAAAESARQAIAAAEAAAYLANEKLRASNGRGTNYLNTLSGIRDSKCFPNGLPQSPQTSGGDTNAAKMTRRHSCNVPPRGSSNSVKYDESDCDEEIEMEEGHRNHDDGDDMPCSDFDSRHFCRRHSYSSLPEHPPVLPRVHPKLPDYDALTARFESLKNPKY